ncbi:6-phosphogluconolactonase [Rheinheimera baltica]|uniref:6-phosphogluconolactonase n=2 Tax=Rheinheimera baltica TaxID=67576 RepID=A0ABT9HWF5_9GAMM|nr:6-phosphogluconolactonase [Rheinheimera baltica]MDP5135464.1 6-phosphogluconolactonase [Rheinheimera baltica]MDP5149223.1 6-phosphogluconolactonase [Rheinheimera baltica]
MMELQQFADTSALNNDFANRLVSILQQGIEQRGAAYLVVSGGKTPQALFNTLSQVDLAWDKVTVLLADDRWLDDNQQDSNERLVKATLLQHKAQAATFVSLYAQGASAFEGVAEILPRVSGLPQFDAVILGMGEDGHTASLFPCSAQISAGLALDAPAVLAVEPKTAPYQRMSLSLPRLLNSRHLFLHLVGSNKLAVLNKAMAEQDALAMPIRAFLHHPVAHVTVMYSEN